MTAFSLVASGNGWQYAAWVAIDLRLFIFVLLISLLTAVGITLVVVKRRKWTDYAAMFIVSFVSAMLVFLLIFNLIASYPVFVIESVFPFP